VALCIVFNCNVGRLLTPFDTRVGGSRRGLGNNVRLTNGDPTGVLGSNAGERDVGRVLA
jgi:hypothetical protein